MKNAKNSPMGCWQRLKSIGICEKCIKVYKSVWKCIGKCKKCIEWFFFFLALSKESSIIDIQRWTLCVLTPLEGKKSWFCPAYFFSLLHTKCMCVCSLAGACKFHLLCFFFGFQIQSYSYKFHGAITALSGYIELRRSNLLKLLVCSAALPVIL